MNGQDSPVQSWVSGWVEFLQNTLPPIFLVVVVAGGTLLLIRPRGKKGGGGGLRKALAFGVGAALVYLLLTNVDVFAEFFEAELPLTD